MSWEKHEGIDGGFTINTLSKVEMSGFEPESERIDLRISTSVAGYQFSPEVPQPAGRTSCQLLEPESPSYARLAASHAALRQFDARPCLRSESGAGGRGPPQRASHFDHRLCSEGQSGKFSAVGTYGLR